MHRRVLLLAALTLLKACAGPVPPPIRTSLTGITGESQSLDVPSGSWLGGSIAQHRQALSIAGLLHIPDVGQEFQFSVGNDVTTAIGVAVLQSYRLVAEVDVPDGAEKVRAARMALEAAQEAALQVSLTTLEIARSRSELAAAAEAEREALRGNLISLTAKRDERERTLTMARDRLREAANQPGVMIARWDTREAAGAGAEAGPGRIGLTGGEARSGFVILAGLRVSTVVLGEDFWWLLNNLRAHEKDYIDQVGITTHVLQAREVAYTSDLANTASAAIDGQLAAGVLTAEDRVRLAVYWSFTGQYSNSATLPRVTWKREPFCCACSLDLPELAEPRDRTLPNALHVEGQAYGPPAYQGWRTISATVTHLHDVPLFFRWKDHAARYAEPRTMCSSPSCPRCSGTEHVVVPGRPRS